MHAGTVNDRLSGEIHMKHAIDPVVEEISNTRRKLYARCGNDPQKYGAFLAAAAIQRKTRLARKRRAKTHT
jgi:hypothetical protein